MNVKTFENVQKSQVDCELYFSDVGSSLSNQFSSGLVSFSNLNVAYKGHCCLNCTTVEPMMSAIVKLVRPIRVMNRRNVRRKLRSEKCGI